VVRLRDPPPHDDRAGIADVRLCSVLELDRVETAAAGESARITLQIQGPPSASEGLVGLPEATAVVVLGASYTRVRAHGARSEFVGARAQ